VHDFRNPLQFLVDKNPHRIDKGRKLFDDLPCRLRLNGAGTFLVKNESQGIDPGINGTEGVR